MGPDTMSSLVQELEHDAYDQKASLSNMLRKAKAIAAKLRLDQPVAWVASELNGYEDEVPAYRTIRGRLKAQNPYRGLIPVEIQDIETETLLTEYDVRYPIATIEHMVTTVSKPLLPLSGEQAHVFAQTFKTPEFPLFLEFSPSSFVLILDAVRNRILDWSLSLQEAGVLGEGLSFKPEERAAVSGKGDTYNINSISNFTGNLGGSVAGDVNATSTQNIGLELEKVADLVQQVRQVSGQMGLTAGRQAEVQRIIEGLDAELLRTQPEPGAIRKLLKSLQTIAEGAAGNVVASGILALIPHIHIG